MPDMPPWICHDGKGTTYRVVHPDLVHQRPDQPNDEVSPLARVVPITDSAGTPLSEDNTRRLQDHAEELLEHLEDMVTQHCYTNDGIEYDAERLGANEDACALLARLLPERWERTLRGVRWLA